jgi:hypothetical protein
MAIYVNGGDVSVYVYGEKSFFWLQEQSLAALISGVPYEGGFSDIG